MKILSLLILALALFTGCATRPVYQVHVTSLKDGRQFEFLNSSGVTLHNVRLQAGIAYRDWFSVVPMVKTDVWTTGVVRFSVETMAPVELLGVKGKCDEGRIFGVWKD